MKHSLEHFRDAHTLTRMASRRTTLNPLLRFFAAMTLFVWIAAVTTCSTECLGEDSHSESAHMEQAANTSGQSHDSDKNDNHDDSVCVSLHSLATTSPNCVLAKPDFGLAFTLDLISTAQLVAVAPLKTIVSRQSPDRQFVFTPEVLLGAAFRSLAPPVLL